MDIQIKKLKPDLVEDYLSFFDTVKHSDYQDEHKCYCVCWSSDDHRNGLERMSTAENRRDLASQYVKDGMIRGYLAYSGDKVVGWCNVNDKSDCRYCISWIRNMPEGLVSEASQIQKTKSVFCFTVSPDWQRKGIATKLLEYACNDALHEGYRFIEGYPKKENKDIDNFEGPLKMYLNAGFRIYKEHNDMYVVRKEFIK